ncbi:hypothetical protein FHR80_002536 [Cellulomonas cellasea]|uniref:Uncharacterized protein n=1 Tax=Cellulomonas cellasea TaxID=43670 RepID=A0A7W4UG75_9CELL|nr:hypothetical protein [Cellulomonas cellasea]
MTPSVATPLVVNPPVVARSPRRDSIVLDPIGARP